MHGGGRRYVHDGWNLSAVTGSGTKLTPVEAETGQSTPKLPGPLVTTGPALFVPTVVLGNLGGSGPYMGRWRSGDPPNCFKVNGWCEVLVLGWKDRHGARHPFPLVMARFPETGE